MFSFICSKEIKIMYNREFMQGLEYYITKTHASLCFYRPTFCLYCPVDIKCVDTTSRTCSPHHNLLHPMVMLFITFDKHVNMFVCSTKTLYKAKIYFFLNSTSLVFASYFHPHWGPIIMDFYWSTVILVLSRKKWYEVQEADTTVLDCSYLF